MNMKKIVIILFALMLVFFTIGIISLIQNDGHAIGRLFNSEFNFEDKDNSKINIGQGKIDIEDKDSHVSIGLDGIKVKDGDDNVSIGWDGIKVDDGRSKVNIANIFRFRNLFRFWNRRLW